MISFANECNNRETDAKGLISFSKCKMYDFNVTMIPGWDYENRNLTKFHENLKTISK